MSEYLEKYIELGDKILECEEGGADDKKLNEEQNKLFPLFTDEDWDVYESWACVPEAKEGVRKLREKYSKK